MKGQLQDSKAGSCRPATGQSISPEIQITILPHIIWLCWFHFIHFPLIYAQNIAPNVPVVSKCVSTHNIHQAAGEDNEFQQTKTVNPL
jgi:hypothetical protein